MPFMEVSSIKELEKILEKEPEKRKYILFESGIDPESGSFWCPDCLLFDNLIQTAVENLPNDKIVIRYDVGSKQQWRDPENPLRKGAIFGLNVVSVPSLIDVQKKTLVRDLENVTIEGLEKMLS